MTIDYTSSIVKYEVITRNGTRGTITAINDEQICVGDFEKNIQFRDESGNRMSLDDYIEEILSEEVIG